MQQRIMLANWWMNAATNGHASTRIIFRGNHQLTVEELRDEAMECSMRHIHLYIELAEHKAKQLNI